MLRSVLPSLLGLIIFAMPVIDAQRQTIVFSLLTDALGSVLEPVAMELLFAVVAVSALGGLLCRIIRPLGPSNRYLRAAFHVSTGWLLLRLSGLVVVSSVIFQVGPALLRMPDTGVVVMSDIGISMLLIFVVGLAFLPLLTEYGLMEFIGALLGRRFQRWFRLPGRSAVDMTASLVSSSSVGLLVTIGQFERGYYSAREACLIACSFSIVSVPFCVLIAGIAGIEALFFGWYLTVIASCLVAAVMLARLRPLRDYPDRSEPQYVDHPPDEPVTSPFTAAQARAADAPGLRGYTEQVALSFAEVVPAVVAPAMGMATLAAILVFYTPVFSWLALPVEWLLDAFSVQQAELIAPGFLAGYLDQFMPALMAQSIDSEFWRFVLGGLAVTQLVFLSEFGLLVLRSSLPVGLKDLTIIFAERTIITAPLLALGAWIVTNS